jgi:plastocyanin
MNHSSTEPLIKSSIKSSINLANPQTMYLNHSNNVSKSFVRRIASCLLIVAGCCALPAWASSVDIHLYNKAGEAMTDAVVYATPVGVAATAATAATTTTTTAAATQHNDAATIAQDHLQFTPYVTVVQVGSQIKFPNYDKVEHHVKSFSPTKEFEIKPYEKTTPPPILFDKAGVVIIYCLIHEWMRAYVYVVDTPYFGKSEANGEVALNGLPPGTYEIRAWHPDMGSIKPPLLQTLKLTDQAAQPVRFDFDFIAKKRKAAQPITN